MPSAPGRMADDPLDRIRLHRQGDEHALILCEGSPSGSPDRVVLRGAGILEQIIPIGPRHEVLDVLKQAVELNLGPVVAVVDRDFDDCLEDLGDLPVVAFDGADLESSLWDSEVFEGALEVLGSAAKVDALGGPVAVKRMVDELITPVQRLRAFNGRLGVGLPFDAIDLRRRIKATDLSFNVDAYCDSLRREHSEGQEIDRRQLIEVARTGEMPVCSDTGLPLYRGKDRLAALGVALQRLAGNLTHAQAAADNVARTFYMGARSEILDRAAWMVRLRAHLG